MREIGGSCLLGFRQRRQARKERQGAGLPVQSAFPRNVFSASRLPVRDGRLYEMRLVHPVGVQVSIDVRRDVAVAWVNKP
jgi:hypothetical protein